MFKQTTFLLILFSIPTITLQASSRTYVNFYSSKKPNFPAYAETKSSLLRKKVLKEKKQATSTKFYPRIKSVDGTFNVYTPLNSANSSYAETIPTRAATEPKTDRKAVTPDNTSPDNTSITSIDWELFPSPREDSVEISTPHKTSTWGNFSILPDDKASCTHYPDACTEQEFHKLLIQMLHQQQNH